jgi:hypothetical protein
MNLELKLRVPHEEPIEPDPGKVKCTLGGKTADNCIVHGPNSFGGAPPTSGNSPERSPPYAPN